ncbi:MAG TPA: hypothetical protein VGD59_09120 [Acidisarcina sp.]
MADQIYLSLWFSNFRLDGVPGALVSVLRQFSAIGSSSLVSAATVYPLSWNESPVYQRIYTGEDADSAAPELAVSEATELLHDDYAYEFEVKWDLWVVETGSGLDPLWKKEMRVVRVVGFGPEFDEGAYEQNGHVRIDFGEDTPFLHEELDLDYEAAGHVKENVQMLVDLTNSVQENCAISSRLLWSESGETLAQKLVARLQRVN